MSGKKVVIIGGGAVGLASAYYLQKSGHQVTILDKDKEGAENGCSFGNAGMIVPSHFIPLAVPGMINQGIKWMFKPESPFGIKPSIDADFIKWSLKFKKAAKPHLVDAAKPVLRDLGLTSRELFVEMANNSELDLEVNTRGLMMLFKTEKFKEEELHVAKMAQELGIPAELLSAAQVQEKEPELKVDVIGGVYYPKDAHLTPVELIHRLEKYLRKNGVVIEKDTEVKEIVKSGSEIKKIETSKGAFEGDEYVLAAGSWSHPLAKGLGLNIPIQAGKGYSITIPQPPKQLNTPSILLEARAAVTPMGEKLRIAGTMEIGGLDLSINQKKVNGIIKSIPNFFPDFNPKWVEGIDVWSGLRPCSPDGLPYIGRFNSCKNLVAATGHAMMGVSLAPVTGKLVNEIISDKTLSIDIKKLDPNRYC